MARTKKQLKAKEPIALRQKPLSKGGYSLYLDIYQNGKRNYEFLKLYLVPEVDEATAAQNQNTIKVANAIKAKRVIEIANGKAGIAKDTTFGKMLLVDWIDEYKAGKYGSQNSLTIGRLKKHIANFNDGKAVMMQDVDEAYCKGFISYLANKACGLYVGKDGKEVEGRRIGKNTANLYFVHFASAMNEAVRRKIIASNPTKFLSKEDKKPIKAPKPQRGYLTIDEVKALIATDIKRYQIKQAFLFAVFCGLRISDIRALKWGDLSNDGNQWRASVLMQKTKERLELPLSDEAMKWLPERGGASNDTLVFGNLPNALGINRGIKEWAKQAGIEKDICFHVSRHTFATALLTMGADLYTTSKLLGHTNLSTTQIYADIVNQKKADAVNVLGKAFE
jgi:integrase